MNCNEKFYKYIYACLFVVVASAIAEAQPASKRDKIEALRVTFINQSKFHHTRVSIILAIV